MQMPEDYTGFSTETALQNGALRGAVHEIEGFVRQFGQRVHPLRVILTGGDADFFRPYLSVSTLTAAPHLTLFGLNHILQFNKNRPFIA